VTARADLDAHLETIDERLEHIIGKDASGYDRDILELQKMKR
jgi:hypothetical protein